jgi:competence/damage-inducible protein CinA C-terminal domain
MTAMAPPESAVHSLVAGLAARGQTLATSESLTGGLIGARLTEVPGASAVYLGGVVVYQTELKAILGGVSRETLDRDGPIAWTTVQELAAAVRSRTGADWGLAVTGVAGPDGQAGQLPGTVWIGLAGPDGVASRLVRLSGNRAQIRAATVDAALSWLAEQALGQGWS